MSKTCKKCKEFKELEEFYLHPDTKDGRFSCCKLCHNKNTVKSRKSNTIHINYQSKWKKQNRLHLNKYTKNRKKEPLFKLAHDVRRTICGILKSSKNKSTINYLGCSVEQLKNHLESQFKPGMSWGNHTVNGWHIDHIIPLASAKTQEELEKLCHYTNLQPLWAHENLIKSDRMPLEGNL